jgi:hypothetical protein
MSLLPFPHFQVQALDAFGLDDLTGQVTKIDSDPFASGGSSDVYAARFINDTGMKVWPSFFRAKTGLFMVYILSLQSRL